MSTSNPSELFTPFLPTTYNLPQEDDRQREWLGSKFSQIADVVNDKKIGSYLQANETFNGESWFYKSTGVIRTGYQAICYIPALPNATTVVITRNTTPQYPIPSVNNELVITHLYGTASLPCSKTGAGDGDYFQYNNQGDARISFTMTDTTLTIVTTTDLSKYSGFIIAHYVRNGI